MKNMITMDLPVNSGAASVNLLAVSNQRALKSRKAHNRYIMHWAIYMVLLFMTEQ